ncbi:hypothetical protein [Pantoea sp. Nvir]|uniref:hypothetical protein n=1 Tax=Pantoea sp. Nvir TaxID=2576760 RepID=UPI0013571A8E|nr:hypothetical protein [Pantoea sp. Nvir]MXP66803.1 hypothetical protein [Pantoea sp. Nvir]CAJ0993628.1 Branched-chain-amino-acid aminotransferase [Pantoea sp. Nvir]
METNSYISEDVGENLFKVKDGILFTLPFTFIVVLVISLETALLNWQMIWAEVHKQVLLRNLLYLRASIQCW